MSLADSAGALLEAATGGGGAPDQLTLAVDGERFAGWVKIDVERSLDLFSHNFSLAYVDRWASGNKPWPIREGAKAQVHFGSKLIMTGRVNYGEWLVNDEDWTLTSRGRSLTGDLEDCSAIYKTGHWKKAAPLTIVKNLIADYKLTAVSAALEALTPLARFALQEGESVHDAIERLCKAASLLAVTTPEGNIELVRSDIPRGRIVEVPVGSATQRRVSTNDSERFSNYYVVGQSSGNRNHNGEAVATQKDGVEDESVERHRPLVVLAEHGVAQRAQLKARATWERNVRAGRSMRYTILIPGALAPNKEPWTPGWHCVVKDGPLGIDDTLLLVRANIRGGSDELMTELEFTLPEAYSMLAYPPRKKLNPKPKVDKPLVAPVCFDPSDPASAAAARRALGV